MRFLKPVLIVAALVTASSACAQVVDVSAITCKDFTAQKKDGMLAIMMWLSGYYTKDDDPTVIDFDKVKAKTDKLADYCGKHATDGLVAAAEPILASE